MLIMCFLFCIPWVCLHFQGTILLTDKLWASENNTMLMLTWIPAVRGGQMLDCHGSDVVACYGFRQVGLQGIPPAQA